MSEFGFAAVNAQWYLLHDLLMYWLDEPSGVDVEAGAVIHEVLWDTDMHLPMMRKLVNESCCTYAKKKLFFCELFNLCMYRLPWIMSRNMVCLDTFSYFKLLHFWTWEFFDNYPTFKTFMPETAWTPVYLIAVQTCSVAVCLQVFSQKSSNRWRVATQQWLRRVCEYCISFFDITVLFCSLWHFRQVYVGYVQWIKINLMCGYCVGCRILKYSREYRSVIKACIVDINRQLGICGVCIFSNCF